MKGVHGTCVTFANLIQKKGFNSSSLGRAGDGVYFWAYNEDKESYEYATALARSWWEQRKNTNSYSKCPDKSCSVIYVKLAENNGIFIDLESRDFKINKAIWVSRAYERLFKNSSNHRLSVTAANNLYIKWLEQELEHKIDIYYVNMNPPSLFAHVMPSEIGGWPGCYIVRDNKCINIIEIKRGEEKK